jgi:DegV family protein with EDD domain
MGVLLLWMPFGIHGHKEGGCVSEIAIVTDSLASMPTELIEQYRIKVAPQVLIWGEEVFLDCVDITPSEFYARLKTAEVMPTTSQATVASFKELFEPLVAQGASILAIVGSSKLTATMNSAEQAKAMFPGATIEIIDSLGVAMSMGYQVLAAARALEAGKSFEEIVAVAQAAKQHTGVLFVVETLEFLHRGGRIGGAARLAGTALNLKPLLELKDGRVETVEKIRTKAKAKARLLDIVEERLAGKSNVRISPLHVAAEQEAKELGEEAARRCNPIENVLSEVTPVVGTHAGPGTIGLAYCTDL